MFPSKDSLVVAIDTTHEPCNVMKTGVQTAAIEAFSAGVMSVRPQKNRKSFNPSPQPLPVLHEVYSKHRFHWSCVNGLGILAHPTGSVSGHNLASMDKEMVYVT